MVFPGSNCDADCLYVLKDVLNQDARFVGRLFWMLQRERHGQRRRLREFCEPIFQNLVPGTLLLAHGVADFLFRHFQQRGGFLDLVALLGGAPGGWSLHRELRFGRELRQFGSMELLSSSAAVAATPQAVERDAQTMMA